MSPSRSAGALPPRWASASRACCSSPSAAWLAHAIADAYVSVKTARPEATTALYRVAGAIDQFRLSTDVFKRLEAAVTRALANAADASFRDLLTQLQRFVSGLAEDREAIGASLDNINALTGETANLLAAGRPDIKADIANLGDLATTLAEPQNTAAFEEFLETSPGKIETITRTATYGSWFNFYLCRFDVENLLLPTGKTPGNLGYDVAAARCP